MKSRLILACLFVVPVVARADLRDDAERSLEEAVSFFHNNAATHGGYVYLYSADLSLRQAEGIPGPDTIWVQPPGTPAVGEAFLDAYEATGSPEAKEAALDAAKALVLTQLHSGGWYYQAALGGKGRNAYSYRRDLDGSLQPDPVPEGERTGAGGWAAWRQRRFKANMTIYDDDVTQSAIRFLTRCQKVLPDADPSVKEAAVYGLAAVLGTQYPNGAWSANFDRFPANGSPDPADYPVKPGAYPAEWSRTWTKDFRGCYTTNDDLHARQIETLLRAWQMLGDDRYLDAARRAGEFLIRAQMPDPQPAWAQAYDAAMHPVWDRAFEPPAITSRESQSNLKSLLELFRATGDRRFLAPIPEALDYFEKSKLPDGRLSRFYELRTNRPIYFTRGEGGNGWALTYEDDNLASNYGFKIKSEIDAIRRQYERLSKDPNAADRRPPPGESEIRQIIAGLDKRGAWAEDGMIRDADGKKVSPDGGIISSKTFADNVETLCRFLGVD